MIYLIWPCLFNTLSLGACGASIFDRYAAPVDAPPSGVTFSDSLGLLALPFPSGTQPTFSYMRA